MTEGRLIIIGCDNSVNLSAILRSLEEATDLSHNIISVTRISDLIGIAKSVEPHLIILCFKNNRLSLGEINALVKKPEIPILCIVEKHDSQTFVWNRNSIVFTHPLEHIDNKEFLSSAINSILLLNTATPFTSTLSIFAGTAQHQSNTRNLSRYVLELDKKVEVLSKVKSRIAELYPSVDDPTRAELTAIVNSIKASANDANLWDDFKLYFQQTNPGFLRLLAHKHPMLTSIDLKYCCYLKMNMTNGDIRNLLGINQESVRTHKYRLKKKMSLPKEQNLINYLRAVI
jgi:DNA-binding CsgD family transcriptional regulator